MGTPEIIRAVTGSTQPKAIKYEHWNFICFKLHKYDENNASINNKSSHIKIVMDKTVEKAKMGKIIDLLFENQPDCWDELLSKT